MAGAAGFIVSRGPHLGKAPALVSSGVRVRPVVRFHCVDDRGCTRPSGPVGSQGRWRRRDRWSRAQRRGCWRRGSSTATMRRDGLAQRPFVCPHFLGLGRALSHPEPQVAAEGAGAPPPGRKRRLGRTAAYPGARCGRPASREPRRKFRLREHCIRTRRDRGTRHQGAASAAHPGTDGVQLRASSPRGFLLQPRHGGQTVNGRYSPWAWTGA